MNDVSQIQDMRNLYEKLRKESKEKCIEYLDSIVEYCKFIKFDKGKTLTMLSLIMDFIPIGKQEFTECRTMEDFENEYFKKVRQTYDVEA